MHWLPLVAMVIASALPFPQSPVPRLVAATIEPGRNDSNSSSSSIPTAEVSMTNSSNNRSQNNHSTHDATPHQTDDKQSTNDEEKSRAKQENLLTENSVFAKVQQDSTGEGRTTRADASRSHDHRKYRSPKGLTKKQSPIPSNDILKDYQHEHSQFHVESSIEASTVLKDDKNTGNKLQEKLLDGPEVPLKSSPVQQQLDEGQMDSSTTEKELMKPDVGFRMEPGFGIDHVDLQDDQLLLLDAHPRVLFSSEPSPPKHPPLLLMLEMGLLAKDIEDEESQTMDVTTSGADKEAYRNLLLGLSDSEGFTPVRRKRQITPNLQSLERSVCDSESMWVTDKSIATDNNSKNVTVLREIQSLKQPLKQFFFETKCRKAQGNSKGQGVEGAGCLGVDKKHWISRCETKHSYVRALTKDENMRIGWRWIRIDTSCVCVLSSKKAYNSERRVGMSYRSYGPTNQRTDS